MWFFISDPNFALIGQYVAELQLKYDFQYGVRPPSWICKKSIFCQKSILGMEIRIFVPNLIEIRKFTADIWRQSYFLKWCQSAILNFRKLPFWSCDLYMHVILHLQSKFRINLPIWCWDIARKRFSIWRPSAILDLLWRHHIAWETALHVPNFVLNFHGVRLRIFWNFLKYLVFHVSAFWLEIAYFGLNFDDFWWKIGKNVEIKYSNPKKAHPWCKARLISVERWRFIRQCNL